MFQIEIYEYHPKMKDIYQQYFNIFEKQTSPNNSSSITNSSYLLDANSHHLGDYIQNKIMKIQNLSNPFIVKHLDFIKEDCYYIFVSENQGDSLDTIIDLKMNESTNFKVEEVIQIIYSALLAVNYLEKNGVILRFLDTRRLLLLSEDYLSVKLRNFIVDILFTPEEMKFLKYEIIILVTLSIWRLN